MVTWPRMFTAGTTPGESQRDRATPLWNICPTNLPVVAASHRHVHLIDAGIRVRDGTAHALEGSCADKDCETIPLLKWRLDRYVPEKRACERSEEHTSELQ